MNVEVKERFRNQKDFNAIDDDLVDETDYTSKWWSVVSCDAVVQEVQRLVMRLMSDTLGLFIINIIINISPLQQCRFHTRNEITKLKHFTPTRR